MQELKLRACAFVLPTSHSLPEIEMVIDGWMDWLNYLFDADVTDIIATFCLVC